MAERVPVGATNVQHAGYQHEPLGQLKFSFKAGDPVPDRLEVNMRITKVALALAVFFLMTSAGFAQAPWWQGNGNNGWSNWGYQNGQNEAYERGVRDGREDQARNRGFHPRNQGQAYLNGYRAGYGAKESYPVGPNAGPYRGPTGTYGPNNPYGGYSANNVQRVAYNNGYQQGLSYGTTDRNTGHSNRPTYSSMYQNATSGYNSTMGDKLAYRRAFQQGFMAGYQRGYNGGGGRRY